MINVKEFLKQGEATLEIGHKFKDSLIWLGENYDQKELEKLIDTNHAMAELNERFEKLGEELGMGHKKA